MTSTTLMIRDGSMIHHREESGVLGIGTGNYASEKYRNEKGVETRRAAAGLWLVIIGRPETHTSRRIHVGQQIDFHQYRIKVTAIGSDKRSMYVKMDIGNAG